jgi:hypothetical protein
MNSEFLECLREVCEEERTHWVTEQFRFQCAPFKAPKPVAESQRPMKKLSVAKLVSALKGERKPPRNGLTVNRLVKILKG